MAIPFPYHYGSHARERPVFLCENPISKVSIPLWFSRNSRYQKRSAPGYTLFPYHYGSHATGGMLMMLKKCSKCFHTTMVLTQPFVYKWSTGPAAHCFHTTMVLTQRRKKREKNATYPRFHTTMVLTQQVNNRSVHEYVSMFPYHYGSHATRGG